MKSGKPKYHLCPVCGRVMEMFSLLGEWWCLNDDCGQFTTRKEVQHVKK